MIKKHSKEILFTITSFFVLVDLFNLTCFPVNELSNAYISLEMFNVVKDVHFTFIKQDTLFFNCNAKRCNMIRNISIGVTYKNESSSCKNRIYFELSTHKNWREQKTNEPANVELKVQLQPLPQSKNCDFNVYAIYDEPTCSKTLSQEQFTVTCFITKVYPEGKCDLNTSLNIEIPQNITYNHRPFYDKYLYYNTSCTFLLPTNFTYNITVNMYPNVTGKMDDIIYGKYTTFLIDYLSKTNLNEYTPKSVRDEELKLLVIIVTASVSFLVVTVVSITTCIKKSRGYAAGNKYFLRISLKKVDPYVKKVKEIDNVDIYTFIGLANPKCALKSIDLNAYSTFEELYAYSSKLCGSKRKNVENQKQNKPKNLDNDVYVNSHYATGIQNTRVKDANIQKINNDQAISMKTTSPIQLKRVVINDTQYTLVNKEGNNIKLQDNQGNYCDVDIIQTPSATSLTSTRNNSQTRLKRVCFNNTDYTLVDKPQKDGLVHILKDNKKRTSTDTSWSKSVNSEGITSHNRKKASNVRKPYKLISISNERLLNDSHETDVDTLNSSDIFAQYK